MASKVIPAIISGGAGTRLWPLSTERMPKQFHALGSDRSLLQDTAIRFENAPGVELSAPMVICNQSQASEASAQLAAVGCAPSAMLLEPFGRNTAAVAMAAALTAQTLDPRALVLMMPSDHVIDRPPVFAQAIAEAAALARDRIVLFGIVPSGPETGYGYIEAGPPIAGSMCEVSRFVEKPNLETAKNYLASGRYLWNAGIVLFSPALMIAEMERWAPDVAAAVREGIDRGVRSGATLSLDAEAFARCRSISIDYAVLEQTDKAAVIPVDAGWADVGSWQSLWERGPTDGHGNTVRGPAELIEAEGCLVWSTSRPIAVLGVKDLVIVETEEGVLVLPRERAQDVRLLVDRLKSRGRI